MEKMIRQYLNRILHEVKSIDSPTVQANTISELHVIASILNNLNSGVK